MDLHLELTRRERHILILLCDGATDEQIAHGLGISSETVAKHLKAVRRKIQVRNRTELASVALRRSLADLDPDMRPVAVEAEWDDGFDLVSLTPRYLGAEAYRRYPRFRQLLDRPYSVWFTDWRDRFAPPISGLEVAAATGETVSVKGVRFVTPGTDDEWEWNARLEMVNRTRYLFTISTPLP